MALLLAGELPRAAGPMPVAAELFTDDAARTTPSVPRPD
jgi:hypothetical protein